jgi:nucleoside-diphosphate-sugar epimerase
VSAADGLIYRQRTLFHLCANPLFDFVVGDARDEQLMRRLVKDADVLIPLAAIVGAPACDRDPWLARSVNLEAIKLLARLRSNDQLIVYPTTNSGYGTKSGDVFCTEGPIRLPCVWRRFSACHLACVLIYLSTTLSMPRSRMVIL